MTNSELRQANKVFINAGSLAFKMGFHSGANPYKGKQAKYWLIGYKQAEFNAGGKKLARLRKTYQYPDREEVLCNKCEDTKLEGDTCKKCQGV
jgi:hypothetical protein